MSNVKKCQLSDVLHKFGEPETFDASEIVNEETAALFLCTLGFEPRCLTVPAELASAGYRATRAIYFEYNTNIEDNAMNRPQLLQHLRAIAADVLPPINVDDLEFSRHLRDLLSSLNRDQSGKDPLVFIDISVAANRLLMKCVKVLLESNIRLRFFYSEAAIYHPTHDEYLSIINRDDGDDGTLGLERGVSSVPPSEEHPGYHIDQLPDCVLMLPSFNRERAWTVIREVDPALRISPAEQVVWLLGVPHLPDDHWRLDAMRSINQVAPEAPQYKVSTFDYRESLRTLETIYQERDGQYKFTLSPMGSKMQAVGAALFCYLHPDVRVRFCIPNAYNVIGYSEGCKAMWTINLGSSSELRQHIDQVGTITVVD